MRIVAGSRRGLTLEAPEGGTTRPTSDRARESLFNILAGPKHVHRLRDRVVADFFAGTGAVGLEALSRGAERAVFLERDDAALVSLGRNIARMKAKEACDVKRGDATRPGSARAACGLVFLDPPYADRVAETALAAALAGGWLASDGLAVVQLHPKAAFEPPDGLAAVDDRRYGATRFVFLEPAP
jgi:16S rRNA (guanine966-N2)-methyltransferase